MRWFTERLVMVMTVTFLVFAIAQAAEPSTLLLTGAIAVGMLVLARNSALTVVRQSITIGGRAREHRESLSEIPAPQHPDTAGRPRTRAPSQSPPAA